MKALEVSFPNALSYTSTWVIFSLLNSFKWCQILAMKMKQQGKAHKIVYVWNGRCILPATESRRHNKALSAEEGAPECMYLCTIYFIASLLTWSKMPLPAFAENTGL